MKPLVSTEWLADNLGEVMVFDCTYYLPTEKRDAMAEFTAGHIPSAGLPEGAVYDGSWSEWGGRPDTPIEV